MKLYLNGNSIDTQSQSLSQLLQEQQFDCSAVATAIDGNFVPRSQYTITLLSSGQKIEVLAPMQGG
jgi:sulfur carrier protein